MSMYRTYLDYYVGLICAKPLEAAALTAVLDDVHDRMDRMSGDSNAYTPGRIGGHNVVIARLPAGTPGTTAAAAVAKDMLRTFPNIRIGFFVGIGGGVPGPPKKNPEEDIRLGDVVVSHPGDGHGGVIQYDFGKTIQDGAFVTTGYLQRPPDVLLTALSELRTQHDLRGNSISECIRNMSKTYTRMASRWGYPGADRDILYVSEFQHPCRENTCAELGCATRPERIVNRANRMTSDPAVHYGLIASANNIMRDSKTRDALREKHGMLCFEMEAAGLMSSFPCLIIRGISDYSDSHKADDWQDYAAAAASAFTKELLQTIPTFDIQQTPTAANSMESVIYQSAVQLRRDIGPLLTEHERQQSQAISDWLAPAVRDVQHDDARTKQTRGTCGWFLTHPTFLNWMERGKSPQVLLCQGLPGAGKTTLATTVADYLRHNNSISGTIVACIYFSYKLSGLQTSDAMLRSILRQIIHLSSIPDPIKSLYSLCRAESRSPTLMEIENIIALVISSHERPVYIIVDALDECPLSHLSDFLGVLWYLQKAGAQILLTSRPLERITREFRQAQEVSKVDIRAERTDVAAFIQQQPELANITTITHGRINTEQIIATIHSAAGGMFLLVRLYVNLLTCKCSVGEIEEELDNIARHRSTDPIRDAYKKTMDMIELYNQQHWVHQILSWVFHARRPLMLDELRCALAVQNQKDNYRTVNYDYAPNNIEEVISLCAGLVVVNHGSRAVEFVHHTTQQYLETYQTQHPWLHESAADIVQTCFKMLSLGVFDTTQAPQSLDADEIVLSHPFLEYAAHYWPDHARAIQTNAAVQNAARKFLLNPRLTSFADHIYRRRDYEYLSLCKYRYRRSHVPQTHGLHLIARHDLLNLMGSMRHVPECRRVMNCPDCYRRTPLLEAVYNNHAAMTEVLLSMGGIDLDFTDLGGRTALLTAAQQGEARIVRALVLAGADLNMADSGGMTALMLCAMKDDVSIIEILLKSRAVDCDHQNRLGGGTALIYAVERRHARTVRLLLTVGRANPRLKDSEGKTAWDYAAQCEDVEMMRMLERAERYAA